jgi:hypothetical protein
MAKSISEEPGLERLDQQLAELFRDAQRFNVDPFRKRRVLVRLERLQHGELPKFPWRPAITALLLVTGSAAAALGHQHASHAASSLAVGSAPVERQSSATPAASNPCLTSALQRSAEPGSEVARKANPLRRIEQPATTLRSNATPAKSEDPEPVVLAIRALRTGRDPLRARQLLDGYLKAHPHGLLTGDALALSIEAASVEHDPRAADYARRYLLRFPGGRFRELAVHAIEAQR